MAGPYYFAWVTAAETTFGNEHVREDESVFSFDIGQAEGDFAEMAITIRNPRIGLLAPSRKVWAWLAYDNGSDISPLFFGRLVGVPENMFAEFVTLKFIARPPDFAEQKAALADALKVAPFYDPIFIQEQRRADPDSVLEARSQLWHIDRLTHAVTVSDVLTGEDGVIELTEADVFNDTMSVTLNTIPLRSVTIDAEIPWLQSALDGVDLTRKIIDQWPNEGAFAGESVGSTGYQLCTTFSFEGMISSWPKQGSRIGAGWEVFEGEAVPMHYLAVPDEAQVGDFFFGHRITFPLPLGSLKLPTRVTNGRTWAGKDGAGFDATVDATFAPLGWLKPKLVVGYDVNRKYTERVTFTLKANTQAVVTLPEDQETQLITLSAVDVSQEVEGELPIGDVRRRNYLTTERGLRSLEYLLCLARAHLLARSRVVEIEVQAKAEFLLDVSCRKNVLLHDARLPGGEALGKVIAYRIALDGNVGELVTTVKLASAVGYGGSYTAEPGAPIYCESDYVEADYQEHEGQIVVPTFGEVAYTVPLDATNDDGVDLLRGFDAESAVLNLSFTNGPGEQRATMRDGIPEEPWVSEGAYDNALIRERLQRVPTGVRLELVPIGKGPFTTEYAIDVAELIVPQMINLEASSL